MSCKREWEIEAARDGRLVGEARRSIEDHCLHCTECGADARYLHDLGAALNAIPVPEPNGLALRRLRNETMASVDSDLRRERAPRWRFVVAASALAVAVLFVMTRPKAVSPPPPLVLQPPKADVSPTEGARFSRAFDGDAERVTLTEGTIRISHGPGAPRLVVVVPDGEVDDIGTIFAVTVHDAHTDHVSVTEGVVALHLDGVPATSLTSGMEWRRPAPSPAVSTVIVAPRPPRTGAPMPVLDDEDATYLEVLRLEREGHKDESREAARHYLDRFPDGFRRDEMHRLAGYQKSAD